MWTENILKTELCENDGDTIITWFPWPSFAQTQIQNDQLWLRFQFPRQGLHGKQLIRFQGENAVFKLLRRSVDEPEFLSQELNPSTLRRRNLKTKVSLWKGINCFPSSLSRRNLKTIIRHFDLCLKISQTKRSDGLYRDAIVFEKLRLQNVFCPHENEKPAFSNSGPLVRRAFPEKLRFRDGLVWTIGLAVEIKSRFQILSMDVVSKFILLLILNFRFSLSKG